MSPKLDVESYNYDQFVPEKFRPLMRFEESPSPGSKAPDFPLWDAFDESETSLHQIFSQHRFTVVEFGSFT